MCVCVCVCVCVLLCVYFTLCHPQREGVMKYFPLHQREELAKITYEMNLLGDCPRVVRLKSTRNGDVLNLKNVPPRWDPTLCSYALPFFGRVKLASAKNFQLVSFDSTDDIMLMFGKISKDEFALDFRHPLTPLDAFAVAIAALAKKRVVS
eukprot:GHVR01133347.1.p1 GENE.GHVR01133347.1~~GHVR01133347.1.p1  ORF type:complete len:151 (-),score=42.52 GHVR01133347.1:120-572(-)